MDSDSYQGPGPLTYQAWIVRRDGHGQVPDDYHATVVRLSDLKEVWIIARWHWLIKWRLRRKHLDKLFAKFDAHEREMARKERLGL